MSNSFKETAGSASAQRCMDNQLNETARAATQQQQELQLESAGSASSHSPNGPFIEWSAHFADFFGFEDEASYPMSVLDEAFVDSVRASRRVQWRLVLPQGSDESFNAFQNYVEDNNPALAAQLDDEAEELFACAQLKQ